MTPLMIAGIVVLVLIVALAVFIATRPDTFRVERSAVIQASAGEVHAFVNDFREWTKWSPWENLDPNLKRTYDGTAAGQGAKYHWIGNKKVGEGRMTIVESKPGELVHINLEFIKPFACTNQTYFRFKPEGGGTRVVWSMEGKNNVMSKLFSLFMNMDKMVGKDFEKGLAGLASLSTK